METILTTGSCTVSWLQCRVNWEQYDVNTDSNTSRIRINSIEFRADSGHYDSSPDCEIKVTLGGKEIIKVWQGESYVDDYFFDTTWRAIKWRSDEQAIGAESELLRHGDDGGKSIEFAISCGISFSTPWGIWSWWGSYAASATLELPSIPRESKIRAAYGRVTKSATSVNFTIEHFLDNVTHELVIEYGGEEQTVFEGGKVGEVVGWSTPLLMHGDDVDSCSFTLDAVLRTYRNGALFGTDRMAVSFTMAANVVPDIRSIYTSDAAGLKKTYGKFIQNASRPTIIFLAQGRAGASITGCRVLFDGEEYTGTSIQAKTLAGSGTVKGRIIATDSRGRTAEKEFSIEAYAYVPPVMTGCKAYRCTSDGTEDDQGGYIRADCNAVISQLNGGNTAVSKLRWRAAGSTGSWSEQTISGTSLVIPANSETAYEVAIVCTDKISSSQWESRVATVYATVDLMPGGKGVTLGGIATEEGFKCLMAADFLGGVSINGVPIDTYIRNVISGNS